jgi:hypothetical protein
MNSVPDTPLKLPDPSHPNRYVHRSPRRPPHLPKRLTPPPRRSEPPDLSLFIYAGVVLAVILAILAIPYVIGYLFEVAL